MTNLICSGRRVCAKQKSFNYFLFGICITILFCIKSFLLLTSYVEQNELNTINNNHHRRLSLSNGDPNNIGTKILHPPPTLVPNGTKSPKFRQVTSTSTFIYWELNNFIDENSLYRGDPSEYIYSLFICDSIFNDKNCDLNEFIKIYEGSETHFYLDNLNSSFSYYFYIVVKNSIGHSEPSPINGLKTPKENPYNLLLNPSFEITSESYFSHHMDPSFNREFAMYWEPLISPYHLDSDFKKSGDKSIRIFANSTMKDWKWTGIQRVSIDSSNVYKNKSTIIYFSGWSACNEVTGNPSFGYSLHLEFKFQDGMVFHSKPFFFRTGTHEWENICGVYFVEKPLISITVFFNYGEKEGTVWFDDFLLLKHHGNSDFSLDITQFQNCPTFETNSQIKYGCCPKRESIYSKMKNESIGNISIVTQFTVDRITSLNKMLTFWKGPISAATFITSEYDLTLLLNARKQYPGLEDYVDFHLTFASEAYSFKQLGLYPINTLRNEALKKCRTPYALNMDVDFVPNPWAKQNISFELTKFLESGASLKNTVFVVPAFEIDEKIPLPRDKKELVHLAKQSRIRQVHFKKWEYAHRATNYTKWYNAIEPYLIKWEAEYEPYLVVSVSDAPLWDERFVGYGFDKVGYIAELFFAKFQFMVLPNIFIIHVDHGIPSWRPKGEIFKFRVFQNYYSFLEDLQVKYNTSYVEKEKRLLEASTQWKKNKFT